jgi:carbonic anhydrase/acetyltransferase-like protein (isoleucine patch superfamily)
MCAEDRMEEAFSRRTQAVIVVRAESYFELGSASALASCCALPIAQIVGKQSQLDAYWITAAARAQGSDLLRAHLRHHGIAKSNSATYANMLQSAADLRRLTHDAFQLRLAFRPAGRELKPGVWVGEHATIHRSARVVAPAYIGDYSKVRAAALVTRSSSIEHHCEVDCGTVVQSSNLLPNTYLGAGLELVHSVAGERHIANAAKTRTALIADSRLLDETSSATALRVMKAAGRLASYLPAQIVRGVAGGLKKQPVQCAPDIGKTAIATSLPAQAETALAAGLATTRVTRDHGNE